jgi:hypothetical protein
VIRCNNINREKREHNRADREICSKSYLGLTHSHTNESMCHFVPCVESRPWMIPYSSTEKLCGIPTSVIISSFPPPPQDGDGRHTGGDRRFVPAAGRWYKYCMVP